MVADKYGHVQIDEIKKDVLFALYLHPFVDVDEVIGSVETAFCVTIQNVVFVRQRKILDACICA